MFEARRKRAQASRIVLKKRIVARHRPSLRGEINIHQRTILPSVFLKMKRKTRFSAERAIKILRLVPDPHKFWVARPVRGTRCPAYPLTIWSWNALTRGTISVSNRRPLKTP